MDYKIAKKNIDRLYAEIFDTYVLAIKTYMKENAKQENYFIETLWLDVSEWEIVYAFSCAGDEITIDKIYYIPSRDELGFLIYKFNGFNKSIYRQTSFTKRHLDMLKPLFEIFCKNEK